MNRIKEYLIKYLSMNPMGFQNAPKIYHPLYLIHSAQLKLLKNLIMENINGLKNLIVLDIGCGIKPYESLFSPYASKYIGSDMKNYKGVDIVCPAEKIDLPDQSCNIVLALQVLEHTEEPAKVLNEINRLLAVEGIAFITIPACFCYHPGVDNYKPGIVVNEPTYPDYWRWTEAGIKKVISEKISCSHIKIESIGGFFQCFGLQLAFVMAESIKSINKYLSYLTMFMVVPFINIISIYLDKIFYRWNKLWSPYTIFLGYAITLKKAK